MGLFDNLKKALGGKPEAPAKKSSGGNRSGSGNRSGQGGGRSGSGNRNRGGSGSGGGNRNRNRGGRGGQGGQRQGQRGQGSGDEQQREGAGGTSTRSRSRNRNRNRNRGGGQGSGANGATRTVKRTDDAPERKEGGQRSGSQRGGQRSRSGSGSGSSRSRRGRRPQRERSRRGSASSGSRRRVLDANERPKDPVKKQILINACDPNEIRVAIREQEKVVEVYVERKGKRSLAGNIYKGRVQNVLPGMEAAFVDIGLERNGFLYVDEVTPAAADSDQKMRVTMATGVDETNGDGDADANGGSEGGVEAIAESAQTEPAASPETDGSAAELPEAAETPAEARMDEEGAAQITDPEAVAAEREDDSESIDISTTIEQEDREAAEGKAEAKKPKRRGRAQATKKKIQELLRPGQEILVQVVKDPMGTKGSRLTTQYSLAGRYLVYVPDGEGLGVSRRLLDAERERLRNIVKEFELPAGGGLIVRTAAEGALEEDIIKDLQLLLRLHEQLMEKSEGQRAPKLLYNEADLSLRIIRDLFNDEVESVIVDDERQYQRIVNYLKRTSPTLEKRVELHTGQRPLFEAMGVEQAIKSTLNKRANLPGGGYLIIDYAEAFTVIDVNTGRNVGKTSLEETITKTNMEAAEEIVRQLRLRDIGGIIVVDFIDMNMMKNRDAVLEHFRKELSKDRTKTYLF